LANPLIRSVIQSLVAQACRSPDLAAVLDERLPNPRRQAPDDLLVSEQLPSSTCGPQYTPKPVATTTPTNPSYAPDPNNTDTP
jgi:hypothetical protein